MTFSFKQHPLRYYDGTRIEEKPIAWQVEPVVKNYKIFTYFNRTRGEEIRVPISSSPVMIAGVGVVLASDDGFVRLLSEDLEECYWELRLKSSIYAPVSLDISAKRIVVVGTDGTIVYLDYKGREVWRRHLPSPVFAAPVISDRHRLLCIAAFNSRCFLIETDTGNVRSEITIPRPWSAAIGACAAHRDPYASPVLTEAQDFIICSGESVSSIDPQGSIMWETNISSTIKSSPVYIASTNLLFVCGVDGVGRFLDVERGVPLSTVNLESKVVASPAISGAIIAVSSQRGGIFGVNVESRSVLWHRPEFSVRSYTSITTIPNGNFLFTATSGNAVCLHATNGRFIWETNQVLGLPEHDDAIDVAPIIGSNGHMYCAGYTGFLYHFVFKTVN